MSHSRFLAGVTSHVLDRSVTTAQLRNAQPSCFKAGLYTSSNAPAILSLQYRNLSNNNRYHHVVNHATRSFPHTRAFATNVPQTSTKAKETEPPPPPGTSKKVKVELRPGPAKPSSISPSTKASSNPTTSRTPPTQTQGSTNVKPHPTKPPPLSATSPKEEALKEVEGKKIIDIAKKDMYDAAQHGILKPPPADASKIGRLFHQARELFKFYWAGLKFVFAHRKEAQRLQARVRSGGAPLTWREHRFILTNRSDVFKLVPFLLTVIIAEEVIPLIVMYVPGMLPSTCVLPSQRARIEAKRHERQRGAYALAKELGVFKDIPVEEVKLRSLTNQQVNLLCSTVGISSWGILGMQRHRLKIYLHRLVVEDRLLLLEGKGAKLKQAEITSALYDRGFLAESYTPSQQRDRLRWWLENVHGETADSQKAPEDVGAELLVLMHQEARSD